MKRISTIFGVGMISMAVALAPAFAQVTKSQEPANSSATTVQPKTDEKAPAPAAKDSKAMPAKPGTETVGQNAPAKPGTDTKSAVVPSKPGTGGTNDVKVMPAKPGTATMGQNVPTTPGADMKAGTVQGKSEVGTKDEKAAAVKPGADVKASHKAAKSKAKSLGKVEHPAKDSVKAGSSTAAKHQHEQSKDADAKPGSSNPVRPSTGN